MHILMQGFFNLMLLAATPWTYQQYTTNRKRQILSTSQRSWTWWLYTIGFSNNRGMACECSKIYSWLANMISTKQEKLYSLVVSWLQTRCIHGSRSSPHHHPVNDHYLTLATAEGIRYPQFNVCFCYNSCIYVCWHFQSEHNIIYKQKKMSTWKNKISA